MNLTMNIFRHDLFFSLLLSYHAYTIVRPFFKFRAASASPPRPPSPSYHIVAILSFVQLATRCFPPTPFDTFVSSLSLSLSLSRAFAVPRSSPRVQNHRRRLEIAPDSSETEPCFDTFLVLLRSFIDRARIRDFIYSRNLILAFKNSPSTGD